LDASPERGTGPELAELLEDVYTFGLRFLAWPDPAAAVAWTLWIAHTHLLRLLDTTPRLAIVAPEKQSGKTRTLEVTESLVPNPLRSANTSTPVLFRLIGTDDNPTVLLDEADSIWTGKGTNEELRALVNAGHRRGSRVHRMTGEGANMRPSAFDTFAAVALAGIGDLPDTVMDRSVVIRMKRRSPAEHVDRWSFRRSTPDGHALRDRLELWASYLEDLELPEDDDTVTDRAFDVWECLFGIADMAGGRWPVDARAACRTLTGGTVGDDVSLRIRLLAELRDVFGALSFRPTAALLADLHALEDSPWSPSGPMGDHGLTSHSMARMLGQYGVRSKHSADRQHRGYYRHDLEDPWTRYLPARSGEASKASKASGEPSSSPVPRSGEASKASKASGAALLCRSCGDPMLEDLNGDGLHPSCPDPTPDHHNHNHREDPTE
jgi:hypothetical protein